MPDLSASASALSASGHKTRGFLSVFTLGSPVMAGNITITPTFPALNLSISVTAGSASNVKAGMEVEIYASGGTIFKGRTRVRYSGTISSGNIPVRELSYGQIPVTSGDVIKIYRYWRLSDKLVAALEGFAPEHEAYTDQNANLRPTANDGGIWVGDTSMLPIPLTGSLSYTNDPDSLNDPEHVRTLPSGLSFASGISTDEDVTITGSAGQYWVHDAVTDPDNSKVTNRYTPIRIHSDADPPWDCIMETPPSVNKGGGWTASLRILDSVTYTNVPEGALCAFWVKETINGTQQSVGNAVASRSHIKLVGYIRRRRFTNSAGQSQMVIDVVSPLTWWAEDPNFSRVMMDDETPDSWQQIKRLTVKRAQTALIHTYTNYNEIGFDVIFASNYRSMAYSAFFLEKQSTPDVLTELTEGVGGKLICDRTARLEFSSVLSLLPLADRSSQTTALAFTEDAIIDIEVELEDRDTVEKLSFRGFTAGRGTNDPFVISWPGKAPGTGNQSPVFEKMIVNEIADAKAEAARRAAYVERIFVDSTGRRRRSPRVTVTLYGSYDVLDLYGEWVTLPDIARFKQTDIDLTAFRYEIEGITTEYVNGTARVKLTLVGETNAPDGEYDPPATSDDPIPDYGFGGGYTFDIGTIGEIVVDTPVLSIVSSGLGVTGLLVAGAGGADVALAQDANGLSASPTYVSRSSGLTGSAAYSLQVDPWGNWRRFYGAFSNGIWKCEDIIAGTAWTQVLDNSRLDSMSDHYHQILMSPYYQGLIIALAGINHADVSRDYGATWTTYNLSNGADTRSSAPNVTESRAEISWHDNGVGRIYVGITIGGKGNKFVRWDGYFTTATTFTLSSYTDSTESTRVFVPYLRTDGTPNYPDSSQQIVVFFGFADGVAPFRSGGTIVTSANAGTTLTTVVDAFTETWAGRDPSGQRPVSEVHNAGGAYNFLQRTTDDGLAVDDQRFAYTDDNFATILAPSNQPTFNITPLDFLSIAGYPSNRNWAAVYGYDGTQGLLQISPDRGASPWIDALGNLSSLWGDTRVRYVQAI